MTGKGNNPTSFRLPWETWGVILFCFIGYSLLSFSVFQTGSINPIEGLSGSHLGYDNFDRMLNRGGRLDISHPLYNVYTAAVSHIFLRWIPISVWLLFQCLVFSFLMAASAGLIYDVIRGYFSLSRSRSALLVGIAAYSFTPLTLSFTVESFSFSYFLLSLFLWMYSKRSLWKSPRFLSRILPVLVLIIGGITITNFLKPILACWITSREKWRKKISDLTPTILLFSGTIGLVVLLYTALALYNGEAHNLPWRVAQRETFSFRSYSFGNVIAFFTDALIPRSLQMRSLSGELVIRPTLPSLSWYLLPSLSIIVLSMGAVLNHRNDRMAQVILSFFLVDILIHFLGGYGMQEALIFGGHWVMLIPLSCAFIYQKRSVKNHLWDSIFALLVLTEIIHNIPMILSSWGVV